MNNQTKLAFTSTIIEIVEKEEGKISLRSLLDRLFTEAYRTGWLYAEELAEAHGNCYVSEDINWVLENIRAIPNIAEDMNSIGDIISVLLGKKISAKSAGIKMNEIQIEFIYE